MITPDRERRVVCDFEGCGNAHRLGVTADHARRLAGLDGWERDQQARGPQPYGRRRDLCPDHVARRWHGGGRGSRARR